jgi:glycosyltransferase involved in cell wall biosynthesis
MKPKAAIIVSTYNWPEALGLVLRSALEQTEEAFELVIADDGSRPETAQKIESLLRPSRITWCHARQEDTGFRQSRVRNLGVRHSTAPLLIFTDHDTLLHPAFVADHLRLARQGSFVQGKRCFLSEMETQRLIRDGLRRPWWPTPWLSGLGNRKNAIHAPGLGDCLVRTKPFESAIRGCNLAVWREDFLEVDGFDEIYDGVWGREDSDFANRLFHTGRTCRNAWFSALQAHLHHKQSKRTQRDALDDELDRMRAERRRRAVSGFSSMDSEGQVVASSPGYPRG